MNIFTLQEITEEWKIDTKRMNISSYLEKYFVSVYSIDLFFKGYTRREECLA